MSIEIANRCPAIRPERAALRRLIRGVLAMQGRRGAHLTLVLADDACLRDLNRRFRRLDRATDVISFEPEPDARLEAFRRGAAAPAGAAGDSMPGDTMPGEIYISMERVAAQAPRYRHSVQAELARLLVHGTLHVLGWDHRREPERARMRERERECLRALFPPGTALFRATAPARRPRRRS